MPTRQRLPNPEQYSFPELPALYEAAVKFRQLAPWRWMRDSDTFAVQSPDTGEIVYCSVMGAVSEFYGISCYRGDAGYLVLDEIYNQARAFNMGVSLAQRDPLEASAIQNTLLISFGTKTMLSPEELDNIKRLGLKFTGKQAYPSFEVFTPNYVPTPFTQAEAIFAIHILEQAHIICSRFQTEKELLTNTFDEKYSRSKSGQDKIFAHLSTKTPSSGIEWSASYIPRPEHPESIDVKVPILAPNDIQRLERFPVRKAVWEFDYFYISAVLEPDEDPRPFYPRLLTVIDTESQAIINNSMGKPTTFAIDIFEALLNAIQTAGYRPAQVQVCREGEFLGCVDALMHVVGGMSYELVPRLALSSEIQREIRQMLFRRG